MNKNLARALNAMARVDQRMRKKSMKTGIWDSNIDKRNTKTLKKIIKRYGWPVISLVGKEASFNAWLIAQHADHDRKFQKKVLNTLIRIDKECPDEIKKHHIAYLTDRLLVARKKKQIFGTQFYFDKQKCLHLSPLKNQKSVNVFRKKYGLPSLKKQAQNMHKFYVPLLKDQKLKSNK